MKSYISLGIATLALLLSACGKSGGTLNLTLDAPATTAGTGNPGAPKALFSIWKESSSLFQADLRSVQFGVSSSTTITAYNGQTCSCNTLIQGGENSGTMAFSSCAGTYFDCGSYNISGSYTKSSSSILQLCMNPSSCLNLQ